MDTLGPNARNEILNWGEKTMLFSTKHIAKAVVGLIFLLAVSSIHAQTDFVPQGGLWVIDAENNGAGRGFQLEVQNDVLVMTSYGYEDDGDARFWLAAGNLIPGSNQITMDLGAYEGGMAFGDPLKNATFLGSEGSVTLKFDSFFSGEICLPTEPCKAFRPLNFGFSNSASALLGGWVIVEESDSNNLTASTVNFTQVENTANPAFVDRVLGTSSVSVDGIDYEANVVCNKLVDTSEADYFCELQLPDEPVIKVELILIRNSLAGRVYDTLGTSIESDLLGWRLVSGTGRLIIPN